MSHLYEKAYFKGGIVPVTEANLSIASSAVLYGLSIYTVFPISISKDGPIGFRLPDHYKRLLNSAKIIGLDSFEHKWSYEDFLESVKELVSVNQPAENVFARVTVHVDELIPGTKSRGLNTAISIFLYNAEPIVPQDDMRLKTSVWRRIPDYSIPSRAKVNGAYVNSVLAKQDALDCGYDDCIFLDTDGHVCELSAANIFIVKQGQLVTPDTTSDLLEGINRNTILEFARNLNIPVTERTIDLTELYIADEVFACGTSSYIAPVKEIDARKIGDGSLGPITKQLRTLHEKVLNGDEPSYAKYITLLK